MTYRVVDLATKKTIFESGNPFKCEGFRCMYGKTRCFIQPIVAGGKFDSRKSQRGQAEKN